MSDDGYDTSLLGCLMRLLRFECVCMWTIIPCVQVKQAARPARLEIKIGSSRIFFEQVKETTELDTIYSRLPAEALVASSLVLERSHRHTTHCPQAADKIALGGTDGQLHH